MVGTTGNAASVRQRRDFLAELCWRLERIAVAESASAHLASRGTSFAILPMWLWRPPALDMGRKGAGLVPVRVTYTRRGTAVGPVVPAPLNRRVTVCWWARGAGWDLSGQLVLVPGGDGHGCASPDQSATLARLPTEMPALLAGHSDGGGERRLVTLIANGEQARWELLNELSTMARKYLWRARAKFLGAVQDGEMVAPWQPEMAPAELTKDDIERLADEIILGTGDKPSRADGLIERCLLPSTFEAVDPLRYVSVSLRCAASQAFARQIGDPAAGVEVRRIADMLSLPKHRPLTNEEVELVIKTYRTAHPGDPLGKERALRALRFRPGSPVQPRPHYVQPAPELSPVDTTIKTLVQACRQEGGSDLADVAQRWLSGAVEGDEPDVQALASELWLPPAEVAALLAQARAIAASLMEGAAA